MPDLEELAGRLDAIAEDLADAVRAGGAPDPHLAAEEKRITRARRAVEKAAGLLGGSGATPFDDGP